MTSSSIPASLSKILGDSWLNTHSPVLSALLLFQAVLETDSSAGTSGLH